MLQHNFCLRILNLQNQNHVNGPHAQMAESLVGSYRARESMWHRRAGAIYATNATSSHLTSLLYPLPFLWTQPSHNPPLAPNELRYCGYWIFLWKRKTVAQCMSMRRSYIYYRMAAQCMLIRRSYIHYRTVAPQSTYTFLYGLHNACLWEDHISITEWLHNAYLLEDLLQNGCAMHAYEKIIYPLQNGCTKHVQHAVK